MSLFMGGKDVGTKGFGMFQPMSLVRKRPKSKYDVVVIGGGPAGLTAALYVARYGLSVAVLESKYAGGLLRDISIIENYPGYEGPGEKLADMMIKQAEKRGAEIFEHTPVMHIGGSPGKFIVSTRRQKIEAKAVIIATGTKHKEHPKVKKASYCATCDAPLYKNKRVLVIGGGNTAAHEAMVLSEVAADVLIVHRSPFKAEKALLDKLLSRNNVREILGNIEEVSGDGPFVVKISDKNTGEIVEEEVDGIFVAIGLIPISPKTDWDDIIKDKKGYIKVDLDMRTPVKYLYAAGDITGYSGQVIIAAGQGAKAAMSLYEDLSRKS